MALKLSFTKRGVGLRRVQVRGVCLDHLRFPRRRGRGNEWGLRGWSSRRPGSTAPGTHVCPWKHMREREWKKQKKREETNRQQL